MTGITLYQRWLSPHKGFRCAHAALYGGLFCSGAIARIIEQRMTEQPGHPRPVCRLPSGLESSFRSGDVRRSRAGRVLLWPLAHSVSLRLTP